MSPRELRIEKEKDLQTSCMELERSGAVDMKLMPSSAGAGMSSTECAP